MKIGVLGAGISGLSVSKLLHKNFDIEILEKETKIGGIAKTREVNGVAYHLIGGHCFNSKHQDVLNFVFNEILRKSEWNTIRRNAAIRFENHIIPYPIEFSIKEIYAFNPDLALKITKDFLSSDDDGTYPNLEAWFIKKFGKTLADYYFIPYNQKIWNTNLKNISCEWVLEKLPNPDKDTFILNLFEPQKDNMPHHVFFYPKSNSQNTFIESLGKGLTIRSNYEVKTINYDQKDSKWIVNNDLKYDLIISTLPLNIIPFLLVGTPKSILNSAKKLKYNKLTSMLWETQETDKTWTYIPQKDSIFHRYIHIGNFFHPKKNYSIVEAIGEKTYEEMVREGRKDKFLIKPIDYNVSEHAYIVYDEHYKFETHKIKQYLKNNNIYTLGRFGEWEYFNMDICIKRSLELSKFIKAKYLRNEY